MKALVTEPPIWSRGRWWFMVFFIFAGQIACILLLGARANPVPRTAPAAWFALASPADATRLQNDFTLADPTLFALMNPRGFSGAAWLEVPPLKHELAEWNESPRWLSPSVERLAEGFHFYVQTNSTVAFALVDFLPPENIIRTPPETPLLSQSVLRVEGSLKERAILNRPKLPTLEAADVVAASEVEIVINRDGQVLSARLAVGAGVVGPLQQMADQRALAAVRSVQFAPQPNGPELTWGRIVIQWRTVEPPAPTLVNP